MNRYDFGKNLLDNIDISEDLKKELYEKARKGKRAGDLRFRYVHALTAMITAVVIGGAGMVVKAGYDTVAKRFENMSEEERDEYTEDIKNDTAVTIDGSWSRKLTDEETLRMAKLERDYYDNGFFPAENVGRVATLSEWDSNSVCYVEEDHLLHLPVPEMSDEQLLVFIDYSAKKDHMIEVGAAQPEDDITDDVYTEDDTDLFQEEVESPYVDVAEADEADIINTASDHLKVLLERELGPEWTPRVEAFKPSATNPEYGTSHDMYNIIWEQGSGTPNSTDYIVVLGMYDLELRAAAVRGREYFATLGSYTHEEADVRAREDKEKALAELSRIYEINDTPDSDRYELYDDYGSYDDIRQIRYVFTYGNKTVDILWDISGEKLASVEFFND